MTPQQPDGSATGPSRRYRAPAAGLTVFAAVMMVMVGAFHLVAGLSALMDDAFYVTTRARLFQIDATRWGLIHLGAAVLLIGAGLGLLGGRIWARMVAAVLAVASAVANFAWLPWYPAWGLLMIAIDVAVVWAVTLHPRNLIRD